VTVEPIVREIRARGIVRGVARGPALVSRDSLSFLGDLDIRTGAVVNQTSSIRGISVAGQVLVIPRSIGSAGAWRFLYQLFVHHTNPAAIVSVALPEPSLVQGAILGHVPIVTAPEEDVFAAIQTGDLIEVDGTEGIVRILPPA
jgi:uncharacterized protein